MSAHRAAFVVCAFCLIGAPLRADDTPPEGPRGVLFVAGGVGGWEVLETVTQKTLDKKGIPLEVRPFYWSHGKGRTFRDLKDTAHLLRKAADLAMEVRQVREAEPDRPVYLMGKSGGAGLVLAAAEMLPPASLERILLLSPAVAPTYDLRPALLATRGQIVSFHSCMDWLVLGLGTTTFGTIDRRHATGAGFSGFVRPADCTEEEIALYDRLIQIAWNPRMLVHGYTGGHISTSFPGFVAAEVTPWLKQ